MSYSKNRLGHPWEFGDDEFKHVLYCESIPRDHIDKRIGRLLLDIGIISSWVDCSDFDVLIFAVGIDCPTNTLEKILDHFCRSAHGHGNREWVVCTMILKLCRKRYFSIANRLVRCANINDEVFEHVCQWPPLSSVFLDFIDKFDSNDDNHWRALNCFLSNGADVDKALPDVLPHGPLTCLSWYNEDEINRALHPTILDFSFRANRSLFMKLVPYSKVPKTALTKTGLLVSIGKGPGALRDYLSNLVPAMDPLNRPIVGSLLEFLLDDQFHPGKWGNLMSWGHDIDFKIVRNLVQYAEDLNCHSIYPLRINSLLREVIWRHQHTEQFTDDALQFVDYLLHKGAELTDHSLLQAAVKREGAKILNLLRPRVKNFPLKAAGALTRAVEMNNFQAVQFLVQSGVDTKAFVGLAEAVGHKNFEMVKFLVQSGVDLRAPKALAVAARQNDLEMVRFLVQSGVDPSDPEALAEAARQNDFEVVDFLLQSGAKPDAFISAKSANLRVEKSSAFINMTQGCSEQAYSVQAVAAGIGRLSADKTTSLRMSQFLAKRGAKFVIGPNDFTPFAFMMFQLDSVWLDTERVAKVKFNLRTLKQSKDWARPPAILLEMCVGPDSIRRQSKERLELFEYLLNEGAEVIPGSPLAALARFGADKQLVERVLDSGAELNAYTAFRSWHKGSLTPLQAAASEGNEELVHLFLEEGADVNSPARGEWGRTALQAVCSWDPATEKEHRRKRTIFDILLNSGAEINAAPASRRGVTALQAAVLTGDVELAAILIQNGAQVDGPPYHTNYGPIGFNFNGGWYFKYSVLDLAAEYGRLDIAKLLLNANAASFLRGITGYDGAINLAKHHGNGAVASLICEHLGNGIQQELELLDFETAPKEYGHYGKYTLTDDEFDGESHDEPDHDGSSVDEELSESNSAEHGPPSERGSLASPASEDAPEYILTEDGLDMEWDHQLVSDSFMESLTEILGGETVPDLQVVQHAPMDDWISHSDTGFILPEEHTLFSENEWMFRNPFETRAEVSEDAPFWQQELEMGELDLGLATFDAGHQWPSSDQLGEPDIEGQDAAEPNYTQQP